MSGHTPGPWAADIAHEQHRAVVRQDMTPIAEMLLESLTELEAQAQQQNDAYGKPSSPSMHAALTSARAAIAKATGASA